MMESDRHNINKIIENPPFLVELFNKSAAGHGDFNIGQQGRNLYSTNNNYYSQQNALSVALARQDYLVAKHIIDNAVNPLMEVKNVQKENSIFYTYLNTHQMQIDKIQHMRDIELQQFDPLDIISKFRRHGKSSQFSIRNDLIFFASLFVCFGTDFEQIKLALRGLSKNTLELKYGGYDVRPETCADLTQSDLTITRIVSIVPHIMLKFYIIGWKEVFLNLENLERSLGVKIPHAMQNKYLPYCIPRNRRYSSWLFSYCYVYCYFLQPLERDHKKKILQAINYVTQVSEYNFINDRRREEILVQCELTNPSSGYLNNNIYIICQRFNLLWGIFKDSPNLYVARMKALHRHDIDINLEHMHNVSNILWQHSSFNDTLMKLLKNNDVMESFVGDISWID